MPWDWFHINAVHLDTDGNLLVSSRNTWTTFKVNRHTGQIIWQLGGRHSSFTLRAAPGQVLDRDGQIFAWQHDPEAIGGGEYTFFDDESGGDLLGSSRVVTVRLDLATRVATLVKSDDQPEGQVAQVMGQRRRPRRAATCSSAGARCPTSPSSARPGSCCSTPSSRPGSAPTAPTCCPGTRLADRAPTGGEVRSLRGCSGCPRKALKPPRPRLAAPGGWPNPPSSATGNGNACRSAGSTWSCGLPSPPPIVLPALQPRHHLPGQRGWAMDVTASVASAPDSTTCCASDTTPGAARTEPAPTPRRRDNPARISALTPARTPVAHQEGRQPHRSSQEWPAMSFSSMTTRHVRRGTMAGMDDMPN